MAAETGGGSNRHSVALDLEMQRVQVALFSREGAHCLAQFQTQSRVGRSVGLRELRREKCLSAPRNQAICKSFDEVWKIIVSRYELPKAKLSLIPPAATENIWPVKTSPTISIYLADQLAARGYPVHQFLGQRVDKGIVEPFFFRALRHFRNVL
jgi:hypothetical protein